MIYLRSPSIRPVPEDVEHDDDADYEEDDTETSINI